MTQNIDDILVGREAVPESNQETIQQATETESQVEAAEQRQKTGGDDHPEQSGVERDSGNQKMVPHEALHAEKQKVKRYTEEVADFRKSNEALQRQVAELLQRIPVSQQTNQEESVDWFSDPEVAFRQRGAQMLNPVVSELHQVRSQLMQMQAEKVFGEKYADFMSYVREASSRGDPEVAALDALMSNSPNPYAVAKEWFERKSFDPNAERERIKAEILSELKSQPETQVQQPAPVMPSNLAGARNVGNRSGPSWSGPPNISDIFKR